VETENDSFHRSVTGKTLHSVFSPFMQASHSSLLVTREYHLKDFTQDVLGYPSVQVVSHNTRWRTTSDDSAGDDQDTNKTTFEKLSELCDTKDINPLDALGIAMTASNEMAKHEKTFNEGKRPNIFDYEAEQTSGRDTETKHTLISAGFAYTEIVPSTSTPNPDHDSEAMTLTIR